MEKPEIIKPLHGLRGGAALTVAVGHFQGTPGTAGLGVVLFFMLSGFLMGRLYLDSEPSAGAIWRYVVARFARVYPLFAMVIVGTVAFNAALGADIFGIGKQDLAAHLLLAGAGQTVWTISAEFQFYAVFVLVWLASRLAGGSARVVFPLLVAATIATLLFAYGAGRIDLVRYLHLFVAGLAIAILTTRDLRAWRGGGAVVLPLGGAAYATVFLTFDWYGQSLYIHQAWSAIIACALLLASAIVAGDCWANRLLSLPVAVWLGEISFGLYLLHRPAEWVVDELAGTTLPDVLTWPIKLALALLLAQIAYVAIEKPSRKWLRRVGNRVPVKMREMLARA